MKFVHFTSCYCIFQDYALSLSQRGEHHFKICVRWERRPKQGKRGKTKNEIEVTRKFGEEREVTCSGN